MSWDAFQQQALQAMGLQLHVPRHTGAASSDRVDPDPLAGAMDHPLAMALRRAAGIDDTQPFTLPDDWRQLHADPVRKRALWPWLRALRRGAG